MSSTQTADFFLFFLFVFCYTLHTLYVYLRKACFIDSVSIRHIGHRFVGEDMYVILRLSKVLNCKCFVHAASSNLDNVLKDFSIIVYDISSFKVNSY